MREVRKFKVDNVREMCIIHNWYTSGNNQSYQYMLTYCSMISNVDLFSLELVAKDIYKHSTVETTENQGYTVKDIMEVLANNCCYTSIVDEEN